MSFHVEADRFLHHMVRMLVGTMVDVGLGRRPLADIETLLERRRQLGDQPAGAARRDSTSWRPPTPRLFTPMETEEANALADRV